MKKSTRSDCSTTMQSQNCSARLEELQLHYIDQFETAMISKYKFKRGENPGTVASDDDLNVVLVPIQARIHSFADEQRTKVRANVTEMGPSKHTRKGHPAAPGWMAFGSGRFPSGPLPECCLVQ